MAKKKSLKRKPQATSGMLPAALTAVDPEQNRVYERTRMFEILLSKSGIDPDVEQLARKAIVVLEILKTKETDNA